MDTPQENTVSDKEIFNEAIAKPEPAPKAEAPAEREPVEKADEGTKGERERDEKGRFASKEEKVVAPEANTDPKPVDISKEVEEKTDHIPPWRLREEAEARREAERKAQQLESMMAQYEARLRELTPEPQGPEFPDFFQNPEALPQYIDQVLQQRDQHWQSEFRQAVANMSLQRAHDKHGELFQEAFQAITSLPIQHPMRQQVINSPDPGETLVKLHKDHKNLSSIGEEGLDAYMAKRLEAALEDPEFLAKALEKARGVASAQPTQQIRTPPSLNKATGARMPSNDDEVTDEALFKYAKG